MSPIRLCCLLIFCLFFNGISAQIRPYRYDFAVCAIFQNEAPYLKEWIEYYKILGAQHFYLYNNFSEDHYLDVLQPYIDDGIVELVDWEVPIFQYFGQKRAYMNAINKTQGIVKWLAILDIDEFIVPKQNDTIPEFLSDFDQEGIAGIGINWQMFGTSFVQKIEEGQLLTEMLTLKAQEDHNENIHIKSIVRPEYVVEPPHVHNFHYKSGYFQVNANMEQFDGPRAPYIAVDKIQINHYWTKDETFFFSVKIPRRLSWGDSPETIKKRLDALNQIEDTSISRFLLPLRQGVFVESPE
ncbi:MAG: glycosyltransferase family 92 protein [Parachlamydiaceae bacterium]|nr:glycosyltransferase family 92 protein [Parachlamydiaceae bacterium]